MPKTILIVDDEPMLVKIMAEVLRGSGYIVLEACGSAEAISLCADPLAEIDLVVSDFNMPGINGLHMIDKLRKLRAGLPAIFTSASIVAVDQITDRGFGCLLKPYSIDELKAAVQDVFSAVGTTPSDI